MTVRGDTSSVMSTISTSMVGHQVRDADSAQASWASVLSGPGRSPDLTSLVIGRQAAVTE